MEFGDQKVSIQIGPVKIEDPVILAPMSGVTDLPFRKLVKRSGAGLVVSEMIASEAMIRMSRQSLKMAENVPEEAPMAVQLAGCEPHVMAEAAKLNADRGAALIDINFGCPVKKVVNGHAGSALMKDEAKAAKILEATVKAVQLPVTLKMRKGWDQANQNAPRLAKIAEECGIRMITVHGRTRCQLYNGTADWDFIRQVKDAVKLPVVVNGDIVRVEDAKTALEKSGADGVMVGRGAYGRPWFLRQVIAYLRNGERLPSPDIAAQMATVLEVEHLTTVMGMVEEGVGITVVPALTLFEFDRGSLVHRPFRLPGLERTIYLVRRADRGLSLAARSLYDLMIQRKPALRRA